MSTSLTVRINGQERDGVDEGWIGQTIAGFKRAGVGVCVQLHVDHPGAQARFSMGACAGGGGSRPPNDLEAALFADWNACIADARVEPGRAIRCIKRVERMVS